MGEGARRVWGRVNSNCGGGDANYALPPPPPLLTAHRHQTRRTLTHNSPLLRWEPPLVSATQACYRKVPSYHQNLQLWGLISQKRVVAQKVLFFTQNLLKVVKNTLEPKKLQKFFFTTLHKILPFCQKMTTGPISCTGFFQSLLIVESVSRKKPCGNSLFNRT